jgi:transcriptional regulator with XRE-family HTH domain
LGYPPAMDGSLPSFLRQRRLKLGLTQAVLASRTEIPQTTYSHWERGTRTPDPTRHPLDRLARALQTSLEELVSLINQHSPALRRTRQGGGPLPLGEYLVRQQNFLETALETARQNHSGIDLWLLSPEGLPISEHRTVVDTWLENLQLGVNYKLLWPLDLMQTYVPEPSLDKLVSALHLVDRALTTAPRGRIIHYGVRLLDDHDGDVDPTRLAKNHTMFQTLAQNHWSELRELELTPALRHRLLYYITSLGTLAVFMASDLSTRLATYGDKKWAVLGFRQPSGTMWFSIRPDDEALHLSELVYDIDIAWKASAKDPAKARPAR